MTSPIALCAALSESLLQAIVPAAVALPTPLPPPLLSPPLEIAIATSFLVVVIAIHGVCLGRISKQFSSRFAHFSTETPKWRPAFLVGAAITGIVVVHMAETHIWAAILYGLSLVEGYGAAYFYVLEAYTTLGEGPNYLPDGHRLISPVIALTGLFTFGWSTSVLVYIVDQTGRLHQEREKQSPPSG